MGVTINSFPTVVDRAVELGCVVPDGLVLLPANFEDAMAGEEFRFPGETTTALKLLRMANLPVERLSASPRGEAYIHNRSADWVLPVIFVGSEVLKTSPDMVSLAITLLQDYALDRFKGLKGKPTVKAAVVIEDRRRKETRRLTYEGNVEGLRELTAAIKALSRKK